jgi:hypothetical protein
MLSFDIPLCGFKIVIHASCSCFVFMRMLRVDDVVNPEVFLFTVVVHVCV